MTDSAIWGEDAKDIFNPERAIIKYFRPRFLDEGISTNRTEDYTKEEEKFRERYISQTAKVLTRLIEESPELSVNKTFDTKQLAKDIAKKLADEVLGIL